eukprot:4845041-Amphidinium_carterae.1
MEHANAYPTEVDTKVCTTASLSAPRPAVTTCARSSEIALGVESFRAKYFTGMAEQEQLIINA